MRRIEEVASELGLDGWTPWGPGTGKVPLSAADKPRRGKLVLITSASPTAHGEGKTVSTIGLSDGLRALGKRSVACIRQPSLSPILGAKGGGSGGGRAKLVPQDFVDVHFTGDFHAVAAAQDLVAAMVDNHVHQGNALNLDTCRPFLSRCLDVNDRSLRKMVTGLGGPGGGPARETGFILTAASETMGILALASSARDLKDRLGRVIVGYAKDGRAVTAAEIGAAAPAAALLHHAIRPNLVQTHEGTPALVHGGPFANVSHGTSSILGTRAALSAADVVVQEAGFGSDLGAEKYVDLVMGEGGATPDLAVIVTSVRANKEQGMANLEAHIGIVRRLGMPPIVALNHFPDDAPADVDAIRTRCAELGVPFATHSAYTQGAEGARAFAECVLDNLDAGSRPAPMYKASESFLDKITAVATELYGADGVVMDASAVKDLERLRAAGVGDLPVCIAKTPLSLSHIPTLKGAPRGWKLPVKEVRVSAGAGYLVAITGETQLMPGMSAKPGALRFDLTDEGGLVYPG